MVTSPEALKAFLAHEPYILPSLKKLPAPELVELIELNTGIPPKFFTEPRPCQLEGMAYALWMKRCLLYYDTRLGKTKLALDWAAHLKRAGEWKGTGIVIAHAPIALEVWETQARMHSDLNVRVTHLDGLDFVEAVESKPDLLVVTWSGLQALFTDKKESRGKKKQQKLYANYKALRLAAQYFSLAIIDEIHTCNNSESLHYKMARELVAHCDFRLGLSGSPFGRNPFSVWAQVHLIDDGATFGTNFNFFQEAFGKKVYSHFSWRKDKDGRPYDYKFDESKQAIFERRLASISMPYDRAEVKHVKVMSNIVELRMRGQQLKAYREALEELIELDDGSLEKRTNMFSKLRQISSGYLPFLDKDGLRHVVRFSDNVKMEWLAEFFQSVPVDAAVMIFHEHLPVGEMIAKVAAQAKRSHTRLYGGTVVKAGEKAPHIRFQEGEVDTLIANVVKGGTSIEVSRADYLIFVENSPSPIIRKQAESRPLDRGDRVLFMDDLCCSPTERRILEFLAEGKDMVQSLVMNRDKKQLRNLLGV